MSRNYLPLPVALLLAVTLIVAPDSLATAQRTFVASSGSDSHPCSIAQPCRSFAHAITQTNAGGEVIVLDSAGYGAVTITKSVSIIAPAGIYAGISVFSGNDGVTVNAGVNDIVVLRGLSINGQGGSIGINLAQAGRVRIESCVISNMGSVGIARSAANARLIVLDTIVRDNGDTGIVVHADDGTAVIDHVRVEHNAQDGLYIAPPLGSVGASATIGESVFADNGADGVAAETVGGAISSIQVEHSILAGNAGNGFRTFVGAAESANVEATLSHNAIYRNTGVGVLLSASSPGFMTAALFENAVTGVPHYGVAVDGSGAQLYIGANEVHQTGLLCMNGAALSTFGNNTIVGGINVFNGCNEASAAPE